MKQNATDQAKGTLAALEARKAETEQRIAALAEEREKLSFGALTGDDAQVKELARLNAAAEKAQRDLENTNSAITEARRRLEAAKDDAAKAAERAKAAAILKHAAEIERLAREADEHAAQFRVALTALFDRAHEISISGFRGIAPFRTMQLALGRATLAVLADMRLGLDVRVLAPGERRSFADTVRTLVASARGTAASVLGNQVAVEPSNSKMAKLEQPGAAA